MLRAAMIAVGGQCSNDTSAKQKSRKLHDRCIKLLESREREPMAEPERLCDYQAVFLIEVLSQYRARRAAKALSPRFGTLYHKAAENFRHTTSRITEIAFSLGQHENVTLSHWLEWIELSTWQRLHASCYILESQQAIVLAREPVPSLSRESGLDLPFPTPISVWDASNLDDWAIAAQRYASSPKYVFEISEDSIVAPCDPFQSAILVATYYNRFDATLPYMNAPVTGEIDHILDGSYATKQKLLMSKLLQVTPIRALLAVSGETWILSEKVPSQQAFTILRSTLRAWIAQLWSTSTIESYHVASREALKLSIEILQLALNENPKAFALDMGTDMGVYFASLVLWAATTAASTQTRGSQQVAQRSPQGSMSIPSTPVHMPNFSNAHLSMASSSTQSAVVGQICSQPTSPCRHDSLAATSLLSHEQIKFNSMSFLSSIQGLVSSNNISRQLLDVSNLQTGCTSMLLWVKLQLRGVSLEDEGDIAIWANKSGEGLGELLNSIVGSLERILNRGWTGWGI
jgi:hypothetical protein